jgi:hypothetical protein
MTYLVLHDRQLPERLTTLLPGTDFKTRESRRDWLE